MTTNIGSNTSFPAIVPDLTDTADIQVALRLLSYGLSSEPADNAAIETNSVFGKIRDLTTSKANLASPVFTGTVYAPVIQSASSANTALSLSTINQSSSAGNINITTGNSTTSGSGGNITLTAGNGAGGGVPGNITINAGGGTGSGNINIGTAIGSNQPITLGTSSSTVAVPGAITVGGGFGSTGVTVSSAGAIQADGAITSSGTVTGGNLTSTGLLTRTALADAPSTTGCSINTAGQFVRTTSSARYKQDIKDANFLYEDVLSLAPKTFRIKEEVKLNPESKTYGGLIAEEVDKIESLKVFVTYQKQEDGSKIPDGISYGEMVSALVSAIKHQDTMIRQQELMIKSLQTRVEQLEN
jgi:hypothetical protein